VSERRRRIKSFQERRTMPFSRENGPMFDKLKIA
jgi:hypothetical protein